MNITKTEWGQETVDQCNELGGTVFATTFDNDVHQPEFGLKVGWNEPKRVWRPYIVIYLWCYSIQIGWLF